MDEHSLLHIKVRNAARVRLARAGKNVGPKAPTSYLARRVAEDLGVPLPKGVLEQSKMIAAYAEPAKPRGELVGARQYEFRPLVVSPDMRRAIARAYGWQRRGEPGR